MQKQWELVSNFIAKIFSMKLPLVLYLIGIFNSLFLVSCTNTNIEKRKDITDPIVSINTKNKANDNSTEYLNPSRDDYEKFDDLPTFDHLKDKTNIGKLDPFSESEDIRSSIVSQELKLKGLISTKNNKLALLEYKDESGTVALGETGGNTTFLLPEGVSLHKINLEMQSIILLLKDKQYELKLIN